MYKIAIDPAGENIYYIDKNIYKMPIDATTLPTEPFISYKEADGKVHNYYSIGVNPDGGDLYLGDAVDFFNKGMVLRYNKLGEKLASFGVDVNPGGFAFIPTK